MSLDDPYEGAAAYTDCFHVPMVIDETVERALFIGLGGGSVPKRYARDYPGVVVDAVEIDPVVVDVARRYFHLESGPRLRVETLDGRAFLRRSRESWDVIGLDAYTSNAYGSTLPPHLSTREFFAEAADHLAADGHFVINVAAHPYTPIGRAISRTLREVFPRQLVFVTQGGNTVFVAGRGDAGWKREELVARSKLALATGRVELPAVVGCVERMLTSTLPVGDAPTLTDDYAPVDTLMRASYGFGGSPR
jgi:spermidine synthase